MHSVWAQRREEVLRDCLISPDIFHQMVDRLGEFIMPYQQALETEADQRTPCTSTSRDYCLICHGKNAEDNRSLGRCRATGHARLYRYRAHGTTGR